MKRSFTWILLAILSFATQADEIEASAKKSSLSFSGEHAGIKFSGVFEKWQASLILPPANEPKIEARFELASAKTGDATYDSTLPEGDWFDANNHPVATFTSSKIERVDGGFTVEGKLEIRGKSAPVSFLLEEKRRKLTASFTIDRLAFDIGRDSDPQAEWVSRDIKMSLEIKK